MNRWLWCMTGRSVLVITALLMMAPAAMTQPVPAADNVDPNPTMFASLGIGGALVADRWNLVRATVQPGLKPMSGAIVVSSGVGPVTLTRSAAPFVSVPGVPARVDQAVPLPRDIWYRQDLWLHVTMVDDDGRTIRVVKFDNTGASTSLQIPDVQSERGNLVMCVGRGSLEGLARAWATPALQQGNVQLSEEWYELWSGVRVVGIEPGELASHPSALEALNAVVLSTSVMDRLGERSDAALREWLRSGGRLVLVGPTMGRDLARWSMDGLFETPDDAPRETRITAKGRAHGWSMIAAPMVVEFPLQGPPEFVQIAQGPVGLGYATYLGVDPERWTDVDGEAAWQAVLSATFAEPVAQDEYSYFGPGSSADRLPQLLDSMVETMSSPGVAPMVLIVVFTTLVGLLLGPIDWMWLKRRRLGHWAWATALAWISLASVAAFAWPNLVRAGQSQLRRVLVLDSVTPHEGGAAMGWRTGVTSVLASSSGARKFEGVGLRTAWRRVRAIESEMQRPSTVFTDQSVVATPGPIDMDIWTVSSFRDDAPAESPPTARVTRDGEWYEVAISGGPGEAPSTAQLCVDGLLLELALERQSDGTLRGRTRPGAVTPTSDAMPEPTTAESDPYQAYLASQRRTDSDAAGLTIAGVTERTDSMRRAVETGVWALVSFSVEGEESDIALNEGHATQQRTTYRILTPLPPAADSTEPVE